MQSQSCPSIYPSICMTGRREAGGCRVLVSVLSLYLSFCIWQGEVAGGGWIPRACLSPVSLSIFLYDREKLREAGGCRVLVSVLETGGSPTLQDRVLNSLLQFLYDNHRDGAVPTATSYRLRSLSWQFLQTKFNKIVFLNHLKRNFLEMDI
jgi:hypothetical protein